MENFINDPVCYAKDVVANDPMATFLGIETDEVRSGYEIGRASCRERV